MKSLEGYLNIDLAQQAGCSPERACDLFPQITKAVSLNLRKSTRRERVKIWGSSGHSIKSTTITIELIWLKLSVYSKKQPRLRFNASFQGGRRLQMQRRRGTAHGDVRVREPQREFCVRDRIIRIDRPQSLRRSPIARCVKLPVDLNVVIHRK